MQVGARCNYIIDPCTHSIRIVAADNGQFQLSRKKTKAGTIKTLVDLRNKNVLDALKGADLLCVSICDDYIQVEAETYSASARGLLKESLVAKGQGGGIVLQFPKKQLAELRMADGESCKPWSLLDGAQVTFDEWLGKNQGVDVGTLHQDLADVYTVVSLFSGAGILDWAFFKDNAFQIKYAIDYEEGACQTYQHNIGTHIVHGDIHKAFALGGYPLDGTVSAPDVIIGGPSCKPFSASNRHTRLEDHPDSDLIVQYMRIVEKLGPKVFAIENVPAVVTASDGLYYRAIADKAQELGYELDYRIVQDNEVGGYTVRKRVFLVGSRVGKVVFPSLRVTHGGKTVRDAFARMDNSWSNLSDVTLAGKDTEARMAFVPQGGNYTSIPAEYQTASKNRHSCTYRRLALDEPSPTLVNWRKPPLIHPTENRTLSVAEAKALHGLPGSFRIFGGLSSMQQQVGNSVPVALGQFLKRVVMATLKAAVPCAVPSL